MKRVYHGCEIESIPETKPVRDSDGWSHIVQFKGIIIGDATTLGEAIQIAKHYTPKKPETKNTKPVPQAKADK